MSRLFTINIFSCTMASRISSDLNQDVYLDVAMALWSWDLSQSCNERQPHTCIHRRCIGGRIPQLQRYFAYYKAIVSTYMDATSASTRRIDTHEDLFEAVSVLKSNPDATLSELCRLTRPSTSSQTVDQTRQVDAVALGVKALLMIDPSALHHSSDRLEKGTYRIHWKDDVPLSKYIQDSFPLGNHNVLSYNNSELFADVKKEVQGIMKEDQEKTGGTGVPHRFNTRANMWRRISSKQAVRSPSILHTVFSCKTQLLIHFRFPNSLLPHPPTRRRCSCGQSSFPTTSPRRFQRGVPYRRVKALMMLASESEIRVLR